MGGRLFEAGHLLTFSAFRMGAYWRWALIRGWALIRINTVLMKCSSSNSFVGFNRFPSSFNYVIGAFLWNLARIGITVSSPSNTEFRTMERAYTKAT